MRGWWGGIWEGLFFHPMAAAILKSAAGYSMSTQRRVLIVDDDEGIRLFVRAVMEAEGWHCEEAKNGDEGFDLALRDMPDLIMLDINMPVVNGYEAFQKLRGSPFTQNIPIIVFSAVGNAEEGVLYSAEEFQAAFDLPAPEGFIEKPVDARQLRHCVFGVMG